MTKYRGSRDLNHETRADEFRALGCTVTDTDNTGIPGWPDLVVGCIGVNHLVEIKNPDTAYGRKGMTADQTTFNRDWRGERVTVVETTDDVINLVAVWRHKGPTPAAIVAGLGLMIALAGCQTITECEPSSTPNALFTSCTVMPQCLQNCDSTITVTQATGGATVEKSVEDNDTQKGGTRTPRPPVPPPPMEPLP